MQELQMLHELVKTDPRDFTVACDPERYDSLSSQAQDKGLLAVGEDGAHYVDCPNGIVIKLIPLSPHPLFQRCDYFLV